MGSDNEYIPAKGANEPAFTLNGGGIFPNAQHFTVAGGVFTTNNYVSPPAVQRDFRMIPLGEIDLQRELLPVVNKELRAIRTRRVYSAKLDGRSSNVTVAVYQGDEAEKDWRRDVARYMSMRHPSIIQIWAGASYGNVHATVFHGDLVPFKQYVARHSPIVTVYLYAIFANEWQQVHDYLYPVFFPYKIQARHCTLWIRSSTAQLSADFEHPDENIEVPFNTGPSPWVQGPNPFDPRNCEATAIESLPLETYHDICFFDLAQTHSEWHISTTASVSPGAVIYWPMLDRARYQDAVVIASALEAHPRYHDWVCSRSVVEDVMENGWIRYNANESFNAYIRFVVNPRVDPRSWLSQANNIFSSLHIESDLDNYAFVDNVCFTIIVSEPMVDCPPGYLFVCPQQHFHVGASAFRWPDSPAYWSLDPSGVERLSMGEAIRLGFPDFRPLTEVHCYSWETSVYDELWQFYWGKGFDPESQDVAQYLGDRLFHVSSAINPLLAHVDHEEYGEEDENWAERSDNEEQSDHSFPVPDEHAPDNVDTEPRSTSPVAGTTMYQGQSPKNTSSESTIHLTDEDVPISVTHKILMTIQLAFMLFIATCWVYDNLQ